MQIPLCSHPNAPPHSSTSGTMVLSQPELCTLKHSPVERRSGGLNKCLSVISQNDQTQSGPMDLLSKQKGETQMGTCSRAQSGQMNCSARSTGSVRRSDLFRENTNIPHSSLSVRCFGISDSVNNFSSPPSDLLVSIYPYVPSWATLALYTL